VVRAHSDVLLSKAPSKRKIMPKAFVTVTAFNSENYQKKIVTFSEQQIHMSDIRIKEPHPFDFIGQYSVVIDPKKFPEMDRFVVSVELIDRTKS
jgi:hypothetical protein